MIFERAYGQWLTRELNNIITPKRENLVCKRYDEVSYKPLVDSPDEIAVIIGGGNAVRSSVRGLDFNTLPLSVSIICKEEYSTIVRNAVNTVQERYNAVALAMDFFDGLDGEKVPVNVKSVFTTPFVIDESDYKTEHGTIKACFISFSATVFYGKTAIVVPPESELVIGTNSYQLDHILDYTFAVQPSYDTVLPQGSERARQSKLARSHSYSFTVSKTHGDKLQNIFRNEILGILGGLSDSELQLKIDGVLIKIQTYSVTEAYTPGGAAAYSITFGA